MKSEFKFLLKGHWVKYISGDICLGTIFRILDHLLRAKTFPEDYMEVRNQNFPEHIDCIIDKETFISGHTQK